MEFLTGQGVILAMMGQFQAGQVMGSNATSFTTAFCAAKQPKHSQCMWYCFQLKRFIF